MTNNLNTKKNSNKSENGKVKAGIRGWLILVAISIVYEPLKNCFILIYAFLFRDWYSNPISIVIYLFLVIFFFFSIYLVYLFFTKKNKFPKYYIVYLIAFVVYRLLQNIIAILFFSAYSSIFDYSFWKPVIGVTISAVIWITYMKKSKRVKATFVH
jgi:uncharacterized protein DUF2569